MDLARKDALEILKETSRTFYIPITLLPDPLQAAVASAYLCMRAVDEIEDHSTLDNPTKAQLLRQISQTLQTGIDGFPRNAFSALADYQTVLPEVTLRIQEWATLAPISISPRIWEGTATMADRMAYWADHNWQIHTEQDLNHYTFSVAGAVGLLLCDLWAWYDHTPTNRMHGIGFGRGLQAVNILRNHTEDLARGVDFFPEGWSSQQVQGYARYHLTFADAYIAALPHGPALDFCQIPLALAHGTLDALVRGEDKLSRNDVLNIVEQCRYITENQTQYPVSP